MNIPGRLRAPTPPFFLGVQFTGIVLLIIGVVMAFFSDPEPEVVKQIAYLMASAGSVMAGLSQAATEND